MSFEQRIVGVFGARGRDWLRALPETIASVALRWSLTMQPPFANLTYNYVAPATRGDGQPVVLKLGVPNPEMRSEIAALRMYGGRGAVALLEADADVGALLLARVLPGRSLADVVDDDRATAIAAEVMRALRRPVPAGEHALRTVAGWGGAFARLRAAHGGGSGPLPAALFDRAEALFGELLASTTENVVLHGDLHHDNILSAGGGWLAIDPKGVVGDPVYETGVLLLNPRGMLEWPNLNRVLARRIYILGDALGFDRGRIRGWAEAQAVLSACWTVQDHGDGWQPAIALAERFAALRV